MILRKKPGVILFVSRPLRSYFHVSAIFLSYNSSKWGQASKTSIVCQAIDIRPPKLQ
jgi:hypothetical protein